MEKLNELVALAEKADAVANLIDGVNPHTILAVAEAFRELEQEVKHQLNVTILISKQHNRTVVERDDWKQRAEVAEAKLTELAKQASEQNPFMYGIMTANGDAHFEDFCVSSDPGLLEDVIWEWNNSLADNEPKSRVVALFTHPAPAVSLAELVPGEITPDDAVEILSERYGKFGTEHHLCCDSFEVGANWRRAQILRKIEEAK